MKLHIVVLVALAFAARAWGNDKIVMCYFGSWSVWRNEPGKFDVEDIPPFLCTHIMFGFAGLDKSDYTIKVLDPYNELYDNWGRGAYQRFTGLKNTNPSLKALLAIGGWNEGSEAYSEMSADPVLRARFIQSAIEMVEAHGFDGLDLDWEYPANRGGIAADKANFVTLCKELREAFDARNPRLMLTAAVGVGRATADSAYDVAGIAQYLELINLMTYDLHGWWEDHEFTGHHSPLYGRPDELVNTSAGYELNSDWAVNYWLDNGASASQLLLGMGAYGRGFTLENANNNGLYETAVAGIKAGPYTGTAGFIGYNEFCELLYGKYGNENHVDDWTFVWEDYYKVPYAYGGSDGKQWFGFDNLQSIAIKSQYIKDKGLAGGMVWSIDTDDFQNTCGEGVFPLTNKMVEVLNGDYQTLPPNYTTPVTVDPTTAPVVGTTPEPSLLCDANEHGPQPNPVNCHKYYECVPDGAGGWNVHHYSCGDTLAWNPENNACDWAYNVPSCANMTTTMSPDTTTAAGSVDTTTTTVGSGDTTTTDQYWMCNGSEGYHRDPVECDKYYNCVADGSGGYNVYEFYCFSGLVFNEDTEQCDYPENVPECDV